MVHVLELLMFIFLKLVMPNFRNTKHWLHRIICEIKQRNKKYQFFFQFLKTEERVMQILSYLDMNKLPASCTIFHKMHKNVL